MVDFVKDPVDLGFVRRPEPKGKGSVLDPIGSHPDKKSSRVLQIPIGPKKRESHGLLRRGGLVAKLARATE